MYSIRQGYGGELIEGQTDRDHIYLLISLPLSQDLTTVVRSLKTQLSKEVYVHPVYDRIVKQHLFGDVPLWSPSYLPQRQDLCPWTRYVRILKTSAAMNTNGSMKNVPVTGTPDPKKEAREIEFPPGFVSQSPMVVFTPHDDRRVEVCTRFLSSRILSALFLPS